MPAGQVCNRCKRSWHQRLALCKLPNREVLHRTICSFEQCLLELWGRHLFIQGRNDCLHRLPARNLGECWLRNGPGGEHLSAVSARQVLGGTRSDDARRLCLLPSFGSLVPWIILDSELYRSVWAWAVCNESCLTVLPSMSKGDVQERHQPPL